MGLQATSVKLPISLDCVSAIARRVVILLGGQFFACPAATFLSGHCPFWQCHYVSWRHLHLGMQTPRMDKEVGGLRLPMPLCLVAAFASGDANSWNGQSPAYGKGQDWAGSGEVGGFRPPGWAEANGCRPDRMRWGRGHATAGESCPAYSLPVYEGRSWEESSAIGDANGRDGCR